MKSLFVVIFLSVLNGLTYGQITFPGEEDHSNDPKIEPTYVLIYRQLENESRQQDMAVWEVKVWRNHAIPFGSLEEALSWLNSSGGVWYKRGKPVREARITQNEFVGIYNISNKEKVDLKFTVEKKSMPRKVVLEADEWEESYWGEKK